MIHLPLVLMAAIIPLAGYPMLYLPVHIVWLELIIHPTALPVFQEMTVDGELTYQPPSQELHFFTNWQWFVIALAGLTVTAIMTFAYIRSLGEGYEIEHARAMALLTLTAASVGITVMLSGLRSRAAWLITAITIGLDWIGFVTGSNTGAGRIPAPRAAAFR